VSTWLANCRNEIGSFLCQKLRITNLHDGKVAAMPSSAGQSVNIKSKLDATIAAGEYILPKF
jgi:hypothetical protein